MQLLEELHSELELYRGAGTTGGGARDRSVSTAELLSRYREIEQLAKRLTRENKALCEQLEETQAELLTRGLEEGRLLLRRDPAELSLASEMDDCTKDEVSWSCRWSGERFLMVAFVAVRLLCKSS